MTRKITEPYDEKTFEVATDDRGNQFLKYKAGKAPKTRPRAPTKPTVEGGVTNVTPKAKTPKKET